MKSIPDVLSAGALFVATCAFSGASAAALQCSIASGVNLNFGIYDDSSATNRDVSAAFSVRCCRTNNPNPNIGTISIALGPSTNSGQITTRQMKNAANGDVMGYQLYLNSFNGPIWGNGVSGGSVFTQTASISTRCNRGQESISAGSAIFGRIFAQQSVSAGSYADTVTITVTP